MEIPIKKKYTNDSAGLQNFVADCHDFVIDINRKVKAVYGDESAGPYYIGMLISIILLIEDQKKSGQFTTNYLLEIEVLEETLRKYISYGANKIFSEMFFEKNITPN